MTIYEDETGYVWEKRASPPPLDLKPGDKLEVRGAIFYVLQVHRHVCSSPCCEPKNRVVMRGFDDSELSG